MFVCFLPKMFTQFGSCFILLPICPVFNSCLWEDARVSFFPLTIVAIFFACLLKLALSKVVISVSLPYVQMVYLLEYRYMFAVFVPSFDLFCLWNPITIRLC